MCMSVFAVGRVFYWGVIGHPLHKDKIREKIITPVGNNMNNLPQTH